MTVIALAIGLICTALFAGAALSYRVFVLVPATLMFVVAAVIACTVIEAGIGSSVAIVLTTVAGLQIGYLIRRAVFGAAVRSRL